MGREWAEISQWGKRIPGIDGAMPTPQLHALGFKKAIRPSDPFIPVPRGPQRSYGSQKNCFMSHICQLIHAVTFKKPKKGTGLFLLNGPFFWADYKSIQQAGYQESHKLFLSPVFGAFLMSDLACLLTPLSPGVPICKVGLVMLSIFRCHEG